MNVYPLAVHPDRIRAISTMSEADLLVFQKELLTLDAEDLSVLAAMVFIRSELSMRAAVKEMAKAKRRTELH